MASINKQGDKYRVRVRIKGHPCTTATFPTKDMAQRWAKKVEHELIEQKYFGDAYKYTLGDMITRYLEREAPLRLKDSTLMASRAALNHWRDNLGHTLLANLKARDVLDVRDALMSTHKPSSINRYVACLSAVLTYAEEREYVVHNICRRVRSLPVSNTRDRVLTEEEYDSLFPILFRISKTLWTIAFFSLLTGARRGEITSLCREDIDLSNLTVTFRDTKSGKPRTIPIPDQPALIVGIRINVPLKFNEHAWNKALKEAQIEDFHFHDLRHTFITRAIAAGHNPMAVAAMVGHSYPTMTQRYTHLTPDDLRKLV